VTGWFGGLFDRRAKNYVGLFKVLQV